MNLEQIDTSTTAGKAEVMRLAAEGRRVAKALVIASHEGRAKLIDRWSLCKLPSWNWHEYVYAIISEPVGPDEVWVGVFESGSVGTVFTSPAAMCPRQKLVRYLRADLAWEKG